MINKELVDITKKSGIVFLGRVFSTIFGFLFSLAAARLMGADVYGKLMYVTVIITMLSLVTKLGLTQGLVQFISRLTENNRIEERNSIISFSFLLVSVFSIILSVILFIFSDFIALNIFNNQELASLLKVMSPILILLSLIELTPGIFRGLKIVKYQVLGRDLIQSFIRLIMVLILGYLGYKIYGLVAAFYLSMAFSLLYLFYKLYDLNLFGKIKCKFITSYKEILIFSAPLLISSILHYSISKIDIFMIGYFLNTSSVGIYTVALKIGTLTNFLLFSINSMFAPNITTLYYNNQMVKLEKLYQVITKWVLGINLSVFFLFIILSKEIMNVFGTEFIIGWIALILITAGQVVNAGVGSAGLINVMTGYPKSELYVSIIVFVINVTLNYFLIPIYGIEGAAFASLISIGVMNLLRLYILYNRLEILPYNKKYLHVIYSAIIAFIIGYIINSYIDLHYLLHILVIGFIFTAIDIFANWQFGLEEDDIMILNKIKEKLLKNKK